jgi:hypothetical protein
MKSKPHSLKKEQGRILPHAENITQSFVYIIEKYLEKTYSRIQKKNYKCNL